ncbi:MFS transporter [Nonomuraea sp. NPDC050202]|uniref:MFS transporter n=1 Tax=Nonomuraea sp. NPDC050202 TaxID=3155035 RepID=UPI0034078F02
MTALVMADTLAATLVLPVLSRDPIAVRVPLPHLGLLTTINLAAIAGLLVAGGRLADLLGRRCVLVAGLTLFSAGAAAMAFGPSWPVLLAGRAAQGVGAAMMLPSALGLLLASLAETRRRGGAAALWSAATGCGGLLMHGLGGWMLDSHGWRALYLPLAATAAALLLLAVGVPRSRPRSRRSRLDLPGMAALVAGTTGLVLLISLGGQWGWTSPAAAAAAAVTAAGFALAAVHARRHPAGAIDAGLWRSPGFGWGMATSLLYGLTAFPVLAVAPLLLRETGMSPTQAGLALVPLSAAVAVVSMLTGKLARRVGTSWTIYVGGYLSAAALLALYVVPPASAAAAAGLTLLGCGFGVLSTTATIAGTSGVPADRFALAVGSLTTARMLGGAIGPAVALAYLGRYPGELSARYPDVLAGVTAVTLLLALAGLVRRLRTGPRAARTAAAAPALPSSASTNAMPPVPVDADQLRAALLRQRARLEAIASAAEAELACLTGPRSHNPMWAARSSLAPLVPPPGGLA